MKAEAEIPLLTYCFQGCEIIKLVETYAEAYTQSFIPQLRKTHLARLAGTSSGVAPVISPIACYFWYWELITDSTGSVSKLKYKVGIQWVKNLL